MRCTPPWAWEDLIYYFVPIETLDDVGDDREILEERKGKLLDLFLHVIACHEALQEVVTNSDGLRIRYPAAHCQLGERRTYDTHGVYWLIPCMTLP
jgi:hypothetical protein